MKEESIRVIGFPDYEITPSGYITSTKTGHTVSRSFTQQGNVKVNLNCSSSGKQVSRSLALLVAKHYVLGENDIFNTPMHLNGLSDDCRAENLVWRPRYYAYNYHRQWTHDYEHTFGSYGHLGPIIELSTNTWLPNIAEASSTFGVLILDIARTWRLDIPKSVYPLNFMFTDRTDTSREDFY